MSNDSTASIVLFCNKAYNRAMPFKSPESILKEKFGYDTFRPLQKEIITNVLNGQDTVAIMPTGGGKSLCYQIPALLFDGLTIVVSPLIALMQDQVAQLKATGIAAAFLNSSLDWEQYQRTTDAVRGGQCRLLYLAPERLGTARIRELLHESQMSVSCITIDEAHCISEWGHDFRPDYREIAGFRAEFPDAVCLALTATATEQVRGDIVRNLRLRNPAVLTASFNRQNIFLSVRPKKDALFQVSSFLREHADESGIIYCFSRKQVDELCRGLQEKGFSVLSYHAGLDDSERAEHQEQFIRDKVDIMVATVAFGMGINKPNVRFVIHYDLPKSLEQYYQEIGRAGRDGNPATALLLYTAADIRKIRYFIEESADSEKAEQLLQGMVKYATARSCRRQILLRYFGENYSAGSDCCCDLCSLGPLPQTDVTVPAQKLLSCIYRTQQRFGAAYVIDVLLGSRQKRIIDNGHNTLSTYGIGAELNKEQWFELCNVLEEQGFIAKTGDYSVLSVTPLGKDCLTRRAKIELPVNLAALAGAPASRRTQALLHKRGTPDSMAGNQLYAALKTWRKMTAESENVPPYIIFGDSTLLDLTHKKPKNTADLLAVHGIGEAKAARWGAALLKVVAEFG